MFKTIETLIGQGKVEEAIQECRKARRRHNFRNSGAYHRKKENEKIKRMEGLLR